MSAIASLFKLANANFPTIAELAKAALNNLVLPNLKSVISILVCNYPIAFCAGGFMLLAGIGLGNLVVLIKTSIELHKGSTSEAAKDLRAKSRQLEDEYNKWVSAFTESQ